jgi:hypothetical protein
VRVPVRALGHVSGVEEGGARFARYCASRRVEMTRRADEVFEPVATGARHPAVGAGSLRARRKKKSQKRARRCALDIRLPRTHVSRTLSKRRLERVGLGKFGRTRYVLI